MKRTIFILFLFLFLFIPRTKSQIVQESHPAYKHFYHAVIDNDTVLVIELRTFHVFPPEKFKDKKQEKFLLENRARCEKDPTLCQTHLLHTY